MKVIAVIGSSSIAKGTLVEGLVGAFHREGFTVSVVKRAPDGFDMDQPGKGSYARRQAGAREVMLANGERFVLLHENVARREPDLAALVARLEPVDVVIAEGFHGTAFPTLEAVSPSGGREPRWPRDPSIVGLVSEQGLEAPLPVFLTGDVPALARFIAQRLGLARS